MSEIPPDIYERVRELAEAIVNALDTEDDALHDSLCLSLRSYYDDQTRLGRAHPFLTEVTADFTDDPVEAARLFQLSLEQAQAFPEEPTHTKMISLAQRLIELGHTEQAQAHLRDGHVEAIRHNDTFWIEESDRLLQELSSGE